MGDHVASDKNKLKMASFLEGSNASWSVFKLILCLVASRKYLRVQVFTIAFKLK